MVNNHLFTAVISSTAVLSALLSAVATWWVLSSRSTRFFAGLQDTHTADAHVPDAMPRPSPDNTSPVLLSSTYDRSAQFVSTPLLYTNEWTPQPRDFAARERALLNDFNSPYVLERFQALRYTIRKFVGNISWSQTTRPISHLQRIIDTHHYPYTAHDLIQLDRIVTRLADTSSRESALTAFLSWIIFTNISLHGSQTNTLLSPTLITIAEGIDGNCLDEFGCWAWEKARVYVCFLLCKSPIHPYTALCDDLDQQSVNPGSVEKLVALMRDLLGPFMEMNDNQLLRLKQCFDIAARVGFGIQRDLRPWQFSFIHRETTEIQLNDVAPLASRKLAPFLATSYDNMKDFISNEQV
ncbi:hypothetical protein DL98DRAFT_583765 [Cadophora sp. DSE1049]|nr:hypothetical protein DL98DRAFT_583765 [Cadophora sp. DSE1049]